MGDVIVVEMCMDRRLVEIGKVVADVKASPDEKIGRLGELVEKDTQTYKKLSGLIKSIKPDDTLYIISNAGANINGHEDTLGHIGKIDRLVILAHTDSKDVTKGCGAMGALSQRIESNNHDEVFDHLGGDRYVKGYVNRTGIESLNPKIQAERAKKYVAQPESILVDTSHLILPEDNGVHYAVVADVSEGRGYSANLKGMPRFETYAIVGRHPDVQVDIKVAESLGMHDIINKQKRMIH